MIDEEQALMRRAFEAYLKRSRGNLEPSLTPLPYDFERFGKHAWRGMGGTLVQGELQELTNIVNRWDSLLRKWHAWNETLEEIGDLTEERAWGLRWHFIESDVHLCLTLPSAFRDAVVFVATNGIHQARLSIDRTYQDALEGDPLKPGDKPKQFRRREREARLATLLTPWEAGQALIEKLRGLDDSAYRDATLDYRNEHSHAIGPALGIGETRFVTRLLEQATTMERQGDGSFRIVAVPGKMAVSYVFGGRPPLDMEASRVANLTQYHRARECLTLYVGILDTALRSIPLKKSPSGNSAPAATKAGGCGFKSLDHAEKPE